LTLVKCPVFTAAAPLSARFDRDMDAELLSTAADRDASAADFNAILSCNATAYVRAMEVW